MELARPVIISLTTELLPTYRMCNLGFRTGLATVKTLGWTDDDRWILMATTELESVPSVADTGVQLDAAAIARVTQAIASFADMLTVSHGQPIGLSAIVPFLGLLGPATDLRALEGLELPLPVARASVAVHDAIDLSDMEGDVMADRLEGLALLAEAMTHQNALGRYSQLLRVLERAFGGPIGSFERPLQAFLRDGATRHWFTPAEISHWTQGRPRVMHADRPNAVIWYQRDLAAVVDRIQEAAIDVLFNKANWQSPDDARRVTRVPRRGSVGVTGGYFGTAGLDLKATIHTFDPLGTFPMFVGQSMENALPLGLWAWPSGERVTLLPSGQRTPGNYEDIERPKVEAPTYVTGDLVIYPADDDSVARVIRTTLHRSNRLNDKTAVEHIESASTGP